ncbi:MAG: hypothetical protein FK732_07725 [Asgard group archaeon]|nr:hypothetical protein [Asgard group archaeon]
MHFKERKFGKAAFALVIALLILFLVFAITAFLWSAWFESLIRIGIIFVVGFLASIVFLWISRREEILKGVLYGIISIMLICSISNTIIDAIMQHPGIWYFPLITLPVAILGIIATTFTILALKEGKKRQEKETPSI